jgi:hypothetical protein
MNLQGEGRRRGRIQGRGARKAKAPMCVNGEERALAHIHGDPRRWEVQLSYKKERDQRA